MKDWELLLTQVNKRTFSSLPVQTADEHLATVGVSTSVLTWWIKTRVQRGH